MGREEDGIGNGMRNGIGNGRGRIDDCGLMIADFGLNARFARGKFDSDCDRDNNARLAPLLGLKKN